MFVFCFNPHLFKYTFWKRDFETSGLHDASDRILFFNIADHELTLIAFVLHFYSLQLNSFVSETRAFSFYYRSIYCPKRDLTANIFINFCVNLLILHGKISFSFLRGLEEQRNGF